jgi:N-acyl-phosphatidylethanolamine-hydrolysing phospholipase D
MGFQNNYTAFEPKSLGDVLRWRWQASRAGLPMPPRGPIPSVVPDVAFLRANAQAGAMAVPTVTWVGHATSLVQLGGAWGALTLLTDPIFSDRASPFSFVGPRRHSPPGVALSDLPHIDLVLVSHNHYDHLDLPSIQALQRQPGGPPLCVVPLGLKTWLQARGIDHAVELDWWQRAPVPLPAHANAATTAGAQGLAAEVTLVPAQHWSGRGLRDRMHTLWGGFAVLADNCHCFFAGDTAYSRDFVDIRQHFAPRQTAQAGGGFDLALLPIGAYEPRWFMAPQHVNVEEAVRIHTDLAAKRSLGVHWGTFQLTDEPLDEPPRMLPQARQRLGVADDDFFVLALGETRRLPPRTVLTSGSRRGDSGVMAA